MRKTACCEGKDEEVMNLKAIEKFGFWRDIKTMFMTVFAVLGKEYKGDYVEPTCETTAVESEAAATSTSKKEG